MKNQLEKRRQLKQKLDLLQAQFTARGVIDIKFMPVHNPDVSFEQIAQEAIIILEAVLNSKHIKAEPLNDSTWDIYENVDRQGGSFSQSEIDNCNRWR